MTRKKHGISIAVKNKLEPERLQAPKPKILGEQVLSKLNAAKLKITQASLKKSQESEAFPQLSTIRVSSANRMATKNDKNGTSSPKQGKVGGVNNQSFRSIPPYQRNSRNEGYKMSHSMLSKHEFTISASPSAQNTMQHLPE